MKKERIFYYDWIKCIAIFLVCLYHVGCVNRDIISWPSYTTYFNYFIIGTASMGVPLFFMVNGAILLNRNYTLDKHLTRILTIFALIIAWSIISLVAMAPAYGDHYTLREFVKAIYVLQQGRINHLWFLQALLYIYLLFPLIKALYDKEEAPLLIYLLALLFVFTFGNTFLNTMINTGGYITGIGFMKSSRNYFDWINPFRSYYAFSLVYFIVGGILAKNIDTIQVKKNYLVSAVILGLLVLFLFGLIRTKTDTILFDTVWMGYDSAMILIASIAVFILCAKINVRNEFVKKYVQLIGANTLGIYFIHKIIFAWLLPYHHFIPNDLLFNIIYTAFILLISLCISLLLKKIPFVRKLVEI